MTIVDRSDVVALVRRQLAVLDTLSLSLDHDPEVHVNITMRSSSGGITIQVMPYPDRVEDAAALAERIWHGECTYSAIAGETAVHHNWDGEVDGLPVTVLTLVDYPPAPVAEAVEVPEDAPEWLGELVTELAEQQQPAAWIATLSRRLIEADLRAVVVVESDNRLHAACVRPQDWCEHGYGADACPVLACCHAEPVAGPLDGDQPVSA